VRSFTPDSYHSASTVLRSAVAVRVIMPSKARKPSDPGPGAVHDPKVTPYQGNMRCFGAYKCKPCDRQWYSGSSWANTAQRCNSCSNWVYPHAQWKLEKDPERRKANRKPHPRELCGKCIELGCETTCRNYLRLQNKNPQQYVRPPKNKKKRAKKQKQVNESNPP
ncbi:unnamed protein product, partial [Cyprideis torosa]